MTLALLPPGRPEVEDLACMGELLAAMLRDSAALPVVLVTRQDVDELNAVMCRIYGRVKAAKEPEQPKRLRLSAIKGGR